MQPYFLLSRYTCAVRGATTFRFGPLSSAAYIGCDDLGLASLTGAAPSRRFLKKCSSRRATAVSDISTPTTAVLAAPAMPPKRKRSAKHLPTPVGTLDEPASVRPPTEQNMQVTMAAVLALSDPITGLPPSTPRRASTRLSAKKKRNYDPDVGSGGEESPLTELEDEAKTVPPKTKRQRRKKQVEPIVYDIPLVERKETQFTGRLGYACLNTLLRAEKPEPVFCSRTCRLETIRKHGIEFAKELGRKNAVDLKAVIEWNEVNRIRFFRVSSEMFPFASHKVHGYDLAYAHEELKAAGDLARHYGHRLTTHPGQFTQLASPRDDVVEASVRELDYHCQMMKYLGLDQDGVIIIHMGGMYGDKESTLSRFRENYRTRLTDEMKARIVLENDEMCYSPDELLPVCEELDIPMVLDYHHNWINPSVLPLSELLPRVAATWTRKGIRPKQHLSEPRPGAETVMEKRAHADRCAELPKVLVGGDVDLMIEAKDKEQAVFHLYRMYGLEPVIHENLRPEKPPRPFVRGKARQGAEEGDGEDDVGEQGSADINQPAIPSTSHAKRTPKRRGTAPNAVAGAGADEGIPIGPAFIVPSSPDKLGSASPARTKGKGKGSVKSRSKTIHAEDDGTEHESEPVPKSKRCSKARTLVNEKDV